MGGYNAPPIDPRAPGLCPTQLVLQGNIKEASLCAWLRLKLGTDLHSEQ